MKQHETARIEMHQSELLKTNQPQQSIMLYKIMHDQSTPSPEEDLVQRLSQKSFTL